MCSAYLRLAEISVGQFVRQPDECRSNVNPAQTTIRTASVKISLVRIRFIISRYTVMVKTTNALRAPIFPSKGNLFWLNQADGEGRALSQGCARLRGARRRAA
jgi:hypothetical protein